jgi:hypothetical protein
MLTKGNALERRCVLAGKRATSYGVMMAGPDPAIAVRLGSQLLSLMREG